MIDEARGLNISNTETDNEQDSTQLPVSSAKKTNLIRANHKRRKLRAQRTRLRRL